MREGAARGFSMGDIGAAQLKPPWIEQRPPFEQIALLLQGGRALGSYQAGVYQALAEVNLHPDWVAGISIGAVNSAIIAGNPPEKRVDVLRKFWETVSSSRLGPFGVPYLAAVQIQSELLRRIVNSARALGTMFLGAPEFFTPRVLSPAFFPAVNFGELSLYDVSPLKTTLERLVDFDRINAREMRFTVGATKVKTGELVHFDNMTHRIGPAHVMASGSLPPGFPATEIEGEYYWDGGIVSNTPLQWVLDAKPRRDTLAFQVDLWNAYGPLPRNLNEIEVREKEIQFSSRTRAATEQYKYAQKLRIAFAKLFQRLPHELHDLPEVQLLAREADDKICNIIELIYMAKSYEGIVMEFDFSRRSMEEHWRSGYEATARALSDPAALQKPDTLEGVRTFDVSQTQAEQQAAE